MRRAARRRACRRCGCRFSATRLWGDRPTLIADRSVPAGRLWQQSHCYRVRRATAALPPQPVRRRTRALLVLWARFADNTINIKSEVSDRPLRPLGGMGEAAQQEAERAV